MSAVLRMVDNNHLLPAATVFASETRDGSDAHTLAITFGA